MYEGDGSPHRIARFREVGHERERISISFKRFGEKFSRGDLNPPRGQKTDAHPPEFAIVMHTTLAHPPEFVIVMHTTLEVANML